MRGAVLPNEGAKHLPVHGINASLTAVVGRKEDTVERRDEDQQHK